MRLNFTDFHEFSSKLASFEIRSAPQFPYFSSKMANFQIRSALQFHEFSSEMVKFPIRSEGCRAVSCRAVSVADSLFRPHPEQRARASREPKRQDGCLSPSVREITVGRPRRAWPQLPPSMKPLCCCGMCTRAKGRIRGL